MRTFSSTLYKGKVRHTRLKPSHHDFEYRVYYALLDVDELDRLDESLRFFSLRRANLFGFDPADHGPADGGSLRDWAEGLMAEAGVDLQGGKLALLCFPRVLGFAFNPISEWYGYGPNGELRAVIHEVRNTFGDRHSYVVAVGSEGMSHAFQKELHVSPFNDLNQSYTFTISEPGKWISIAIEQNDDEGTMFRAGMRLTRMDMSDRNLLKLFVTHPLLTIKVVAGIHWQALRLWLKGAKYHKRPEPARLAHTIVGKVGIPS